MKTIRFYFVMLLAIPVLLAEVPIREMMRAWRNSTIYRNYRRNLRSYAAIWREGP